MAITIGYRYNSLLSKPEDLDHSQMGWPQQKASIVSVLEMKGSDLYICFKFMR